jgi:hypothetical protein
MFVYNAMIFGERRTIYLEVQDTMGECSLGFGAEWDIHTFFFGLLIDMTLSGTRLLQKCRERLRTKRP